MRSNFNEALRAVLVHEGGYANHPKDPGGATMKGVTQRVYDAYRRNNGREVQSVRNISEAELNAIYYQQYWMIVRGDQLPGGLDYAAFDYAVNSGPSRAIKHLQGVLGVKVDGVPGNSTLAAANSGDVAAHINKLCDRRLAFVKELSTWPTFGKGWTSRIAGVRSKALTMVERRPIVEAPVPLPQPTPPPEQVSKGTSIGQVMAWIVAALVAGIAAWLGLGGH
jgi:lysozyme family protein